MNTTLAVCMIVKNEEKLITKCLLSIRSADEIIILDTGSTDNTSQYVKDFKYNFNQNIHYIENVYKWNDNFAEARNKALEYATGDWWKEKIL